LAGEEPKKPHRSFFKKRAENMDMKEAIREYTEKNWKIFPVAKNSKKPAKRLSGERLSYEDATDDFDTVASYFEKNPDANLGLNLVDSGLVCIDVDSYKKDCEFRAWMADKDMPDTLVQRSANGGTHYIFKSDKTEQYPGLVCKHVDIKHKGYILIEPSSIDGKKYIWQTDDLPANVPKWIPRKYTISQNLPEVINPPKSNIIQIDLQRGTVNPSDLINRILAGDNWHNNIVSLTGFYVSQSWTDSQIHNVTDQLTAPGYTLDQTRREVQQAIDGALGKGYAPVAPRSPSEVLTAPVAAPLKAEVSSQLIYPGSAKPILSSNYLVKRWMDRGTTSVIYGESNIGKSFFVMDMSYCIAAGIPWHGNKTIQGPVAYLALEGGSGINNRLYAIQQKYNCQNVPLAVRPAPLDMLNSEEDLQTLSAIIQDIQEQYGPLAMIVVDTLSRALAGGDENSSTDLGAMVKVTDAVCAQSGAHVCMVHHSGKDQSRGARGHSLLRASVSTEIELTKIDGVSFATATKQRDQEPAEPFSFVLESIELGHDQDGDAVTTAVVKEASDEDAQEAKQKQKPGGKNQITIWNAFKQLKSDNVGMPNPGGTGWPESGSKWCINAVQMRDFARGQMNTANNRSAYDRALDALLQSGLMAMNDGYLWITTKEGKHYV
jgi:hypothetical protein